MKGNAQMVDGTYTAQIDAPLGKKEGKITIRTQGDVAFADIDAPVIGKQHLEGRADGDTCFFQGSEKVFLVGQIDYTMQGTVSGDSLHVDVQSNKGDFALEGTRVQ